MRALLIIALLVSWFLPLIIAAMYKLPHQGRIAVLSLLLGWTGAGWVAGLVIAVGGAIRATRPLPDSREQPQGPAAPAPAYSPAPARGPARVAWPAQAQSPAQAPAPQPGQAAERPAPPWPDRLP